MSHRQQIFTYVAHQYGVSPEYLWEKFPSYAVLRHGSKKAKWFALIANVPNSKLGLNEKGNSEIINLKGNPDMINLLQQDKNIFPAYHMNKKHWFSIRLEQDFPFEDILPLLDWSYRLTAQ